MTEFEFSSHAAEMLVERRILEEWVWRTIETPAERWTSMDGNVHYAKTIQEWEGCMLHVVVNPSVSPHRIVTLFFDRRLRKSK